MRNRYVTPPTNRKTNNMEFQTKIREQNDNRNIFTIIFWWELRRILYNAIVLICGITSYTLMDLLVDIPPGQDLQEPIAIIGFALLCNVFYTLGWLTEICIKRNITYGPKMFKKGLYFTLFFIFLPLVIHFILWVLRGFKLMY